MTEPFASLPFDNSYGRLPGKFYARLNPSPSSAPYLIEFNQALAKDLGILEHFGDPEATARLLSGSFFPKGADPLAMVYAGHQFGGWVPQLGDGRALLLGEILDPQEVRYDIHLKGSGPTPFSRNGDGRAALGPVLREYLVSEAMHALGVPTTRALAIVTTGDDVRRETALEGAVLTRIARSHIRVGTFQYFYALGDHAALRQLADYAIDRLYPDCRSADNPYLAMYEEVIRRQAHLVAKWLQFGFIHGVMNTDNMALSGETIDFGPCAFMDEFHPAKVFSSIDRQGRYSWGNQPHMAQWNLSQLATALLPLFHEDENEAVSLAQDSLGLFSQVFNQSYLEKFGQKLGLVLSDEEDEAFLGSTLELLTKHKVDFTRFFHHLTQYAQDDTHKGLEALFANKRALANWQGDWQARVARQVSSPLERHKPMRRANPVYCPRNHQIEAAIQAAYRGNFEPFRRLHAVLQSPFTPQAGCEDYEFPPSEDERVYATFCGT
ncbi:MAG: YdiU family protein [Cohaesibacter sp.]|nr:YdiU family protein [Cohaesibacter sp.]